MAEGGDIRVEYSECLALFMNKRLVDFEKVNSTILYRIVGKLEAYNVCFARTVRWLLSISCLQIAEPPHHLKYWNDTTMLHTIAIKKRRRPFSVMRLPNNIHDFDKNSFPYIN